MFKTLTHFSLLSITLLNIDSFASPAPRQGPAAGVAGKQIFGKGVHSQCLPYALGVTQVLRDQYKVGSVEIVNTWMVPGFPQHHGPAYCRLLCHHGIRNNETLGRG